MDDPDFSLELAAIARGFSRVAGIDEVGRGSLAGPVMAAAVILDPERIPEGLNDSKKLSPKKRNALHDQLVEVADYAVGQASVEEIEKLNIVRATHLAMIRALASLKDAADYALIDGNMIPHDIALPAEAVVKGDTRSVSIAAASIVAKIRRDRIMMDLAQHYPGYGWETNAGYGSKKHMEALANLGVTPHHRRSFKPIHNILYQGKFVNL